MRLWLSSGIVPGVPGTAVVEMGGVGGGAASLGGNPAGGGA